MCRQNQLWGWMLLSFGAGVLLGLWLEGGFLSHCFAFGTIVLGIGFLRKR